MEGEGSGSLSGLAIRIAIADIAHPLDRMLIPRLILQKMVGSAHPTVRSVDLTLRYWTTRGRDLEITPTATSRSLRWGEGGDGNRLTRYCRYDIILGVRGCGKEIWVYAWRWAGNG